MNVLQMLEKTTCKRFQPTHIVKNHDMIAIEDLQVSNMMKIINLPKRLARCLGINSERCLNTKQSGMVALLLP
ncbi:hypothetical protein SAMN04489735_103610 [Aneurinibacillus thermoaerophilus]|uniref:Uncharacterized protein n=1 Tax=Aneurinibacillus thermoaerophilus TaxID=143495 RepID=A0A1G8DSP5_ANETH|nr:hypothetical protein SAMN04489735_103610 [Aneurinibacillus thermoaerophilus]